MNHEKFGSKKLLKLKYRTGDQIIQIFYQIGPPQKLHPPLANLYKFEHPEWSTPESYKMHWNLINDKEFGSTKLLKLTYRMKDQIIQTLCKIGSYQKLGPPTFISRNFKTLRKVLLNHAEYIDKQWMTKNLGLKNF